MEQKETLIFNSDIEVDGNLRISDDILVGDKSIKETLTNAVGKATALGGEIFNDYENNQAIGSYSHAEGKNTFAVGSSTHASGMRVSAGTKAHTVVAVIPTYQRLCLDISTEEYASIKSGDQFYCTLCCADTEGNLYPVAFTSKVVSKGGPVKADGVDRYFIQADCLPSDVYTNTHKRPYQYDQNDEFGNDRGWNVFVFLKDNSYAYTDSPVGSREVGVSAHAEGLNTSATGKASHAEGKSTFAFGDYSHAEGDSTVAVGIASVAEGIETQAIGKSSHASGSNSIAGAPNSFAEGDNTLAGVRGFAIAEKPADPVEGVTTIKLKDGVSGLAVGDVYSFRMNNNFSDCGQITSIDTTTKTITVNGYPVPSKPEYITFTDEQSFLWVARKPLIGYRWLDSCQHAEGHSTKALMVGAHAEGYNTIASGRYAHAEGNGTFAGYASHAEGVNTKAIGGGAHAEGLDTIAIGDQTHAEGYMSETYGVQAHAEGYKTKATGGRSHAQNYETQAIGSFSHAGGFNSIAYGARGFVHGHWLRSSEYVDSQAVFGKYNDYEDRTAQFAVGNGKSDTQRSNAFIVTTDGRAKVQTDAVDKMDLVTKHYVDDIKSIAQTALDKVEGIQRFATMTELNAFICPNGPDAFLSPNTDISLEPNDYLVVFVPNNEVVYFDMNVNAYNVLTGTEFTLKSYTERVSVDSDNHSNYYGYVCNDTGEKISVTSMSLIYYTKEDDGSGEIVDVPYDYSTDFTTYKVVSDLSQLTEEDANCQYIDLAVGTRFLVTEDPEAIYVWNGTELVREVKIKESILNGKKITVTGDSICSGIPDLMRVEGDQTWNYAKILRENYGMNVSNFGVSGGTICNVPNAYYCIASPAEIAKFPADSDYVILEGGVNDAGTRFTNGEVELGEISDSYDFSDVTVGTNFCQAFEKMLYEVTTRFIGKKIGYIAVHPCSPRFTPLATESENFYLAAKKCCEKWGVPFLDLTSNCPPFYKLNSSLRKDYFVTRNFGDGAQLDGGTHPNKLGYETFYIPKIVSWLESL